MRKILTILIIGSCLAGVLEAQDWKQYPYTPEGSLITFPNDEGWHPDESSEWWYIAGHLTGKQTGNPYSFAVSYFYYPALGYDGFRILNIARDDTGEFFSDAQGLNYTAMAEDSLDIRATLMFGTTEAWIYRTDTSGNTIPFEYRIDAASSEGGLSLSSKSLKNPLILGDSGHFNQGASSYTYYYSFTENTIMGSISFGEISEEVSGTAWIDKQYGTFSPASEEFYEWFSVNLSNGMDLVLWDIFTAQNRLPDKATYRHMSVWQDSVTQFTTHDYQLERLSYAYMPDTVMCYAQKWHLFSQTMQMDLVITTLNSHADVQLPFRFYEGATSVTGSVEGVPVTGRGFAELVKSYQPPEPAILYPQGGTWKDSLRIGWTLLNPDDGYNLSYDLEYSIDNGTTYNYMVQGLRDNKYVWGNPGTLEKGDSCWFRVSAYTPDTILTGMAISLKASVYDPDGATFIFPDPEYPETEFSLYPNPSKDHLIIKGKNPGTFSYKIYDASGKMVKAGMEANPDNQTTISLSGIEPGIYMLVIFPEESDIQRFQLIKI